MPKLRQHLTAPRDANEIITTVWGSFTCRRKGGMLARPTQSGPRQPDHTADVQLKNREGQPMHRIILAALAASTVLSAGAAQAQQPPIDWDKIEIKTTDLGN